ncbi:helix-turn-helix domain-containing protein [Acidovorax sp. LjRoot129]|uniref:helix-turn-helix domain-containing protein n=1 Tax=unclassified Acidovorax TaxID=2684926 RepID=UPI003ECF4F13
MAVYQTAFREEIARIVRKETKDEFQRLRKTVTSHRSEIAVLKRENLVLRAAIKNLARAVPAPEASTVSAEAPARSTRPFSPTVLIKKREALGFNQLQMAALVGVAPISLRRWEAGQAVPRAKQLAQIRAVMAVGKKEALNRVGAPS